MRDSTINIFKNFLVFRVHDELSRDEILSKVGNILFLNNAVKKSFIPNIQKREKEFPTGLTLENGFNTAIPHTDHEHVYKDMIAVVISDKGVAFNSIDASCYNIKCKVFFVMALTLKNKNEALAKISELLVAECDILKKFSSMPDREILNIMSCL